MTQPDYGWNYYKHPACGWFYVFVERNPEFDCKEFTEYVIAHNKADRDSGELHDIALHEVLRLAYEFTENRWRFPNMYGKAKEAPRAE